MEAMWAVLRERMVKREEGWEDAPGIKGWAWWERTETPAVEAAGGRVVEAVVEAGGAPRGGVGRLDAAIFRG